MEYSIFFQLTTICNWDLAAVKFHRNVLRFVLIVKGSIFLKFPQYYVLSWGRFDRSVFFDSSAFAKIWPSSSRFHHRELAFIDYFFFTFRVTDWDGALIVLMIWLQLRSVNTGCIWREIYLNWSCRFANWQSIDARCSCDCALVWAINNSYKQG